MPLVRFEPTITASERQQTYALDRVATGNGQKETVREAIYLKCITRSRTAIVAVDKL